jgi:YHS domain-containing protein
MDRRRFLTITLLAASLLALPVLAEAVAPVYSPFLGGAIRGYDPVAYFTEGRPLEGKRAFSLKWKGATWYFSSAKHRDMFQANPEKYAPQYGGYCAYAVSQGYTASIDPEAWKIVDGKLYLNYSKSVKELWEKDIPGHIKHADRNWPKILAGS